MSSMTEPTRESEAPQANDRNPAITPGLDVTGVVNAIFDALERPGAHRRDDVRRVIGESLVYTRTQGFQDGRRSVQREVSRALDL